MEGGGGLMCELDVKKISKNEGEKTHRLDLYQHWKQLCKIMHWIYSIQ